MFYPVSLRFIDSVWETVGAPRIGGKDVCEGFFGGCCVGFVCLPNVFAAIDIQQSSRHKRENMRSMPHLVRDITI